MTPTPKEGQPTGLPNDKALKEWADSGKTFYVMIEGKRIWAADVAILAISLKKQLADAHLALELDEKRRAAFQNLFDAVALAEKTAEDETQPQKDVEAYTRNVLSKMAECRKAGIKELDALAPAQDPK